MYPGMFPVGGTYNPIFPMMPPNYSYTLPVPPQGTKNIIYQGNVTINNYYNTPPPVHRPIATNPTVRVARSQYPNRKSPPAVYSSHVVTPVQNPYQKNTNTTTESFQYIDQGIDDMSLNNMMDTVEEETFHLPESHSDSDNSEN